MKAIVSLVLFFVVVGIGLFFVPVPPEILFWIVVGIGVFDGAVYRLTIKKAKHQRIGITAGEHSFDTKFFNNPWAKKWHRFVVLTRLLIAIQIIFLTAGSLLCGEILRVIISGSQR